MPEEMETEVGKRKYLFNEFADRLIQERYDSRTETIDRLAERLNMPRWAVKKRAQMLAVARTKEKLWSEKEEMFLEANVHRLSVAVLARKLGRSATAVALKARRLGLRKSGEGYTAKALAQAFGVDDHKVVGWIKAGLVKALHRNSERSRDMYFVSDLEVKRFVSAHPTEFDLKRVDQIWFIDLLVGIGR